MLNKEIIDLGNIINEALQHEHDHYIEEMAELSQNEEVYRNE